MDVYAAASIGNAEILERQSSERTERQQINEGQEQIDSKYFFDRAMNLSKNRFSASTRTQASFDTDKNLEFPSAKAIFGDYLCYCSDVDEASDNTPDNSALLADRELYFERIASLQSNLVENRLPQSEGMTSSKQDAGREGSFSLNIKGNQWHHEECTDDLYKSQDKDSSFGRIYQFQQSPTINDQLDSLVSREIGKTETFVGEYNDPSHIRERSVEEGHSPYGLSHAHLSENMTLFPDGTPVRLSAHNLRGRMKDHKISRFDGNWFGERARIDKQMTNASLRPTAFQCVKLVKDGKPIEGSHPCTKCDDVFGDRIALQNHLRKIHKCGSAARVRCPRCPKTMQSTANLNRHIRICHATDEYRCPVCNVSYATVRSLSDHIRQNHRGELDENGKPLVKSEQKRPRDTCFICTECNRTFKTKRNLIRHYDGVHLNIRPFVCVLCKKDFSTKSNMQVHMNTHSKSQNCHPI